MAYNLLPLQQFFDSSGNPLSSGSLTAYYPSTTTAKAIYTDSTGGNELANPINFDTAGRVAGGIWGTGLYKIKVTDGASGTGTTIWSLDNISSAPDITAAAVAGTTPVSAINRLDNTTFVYSKLLQADGTTLSSSLSDGAEVAYNWYVITQTASITAAKMTSTSATLFTTGLRLTQSQAAAQRIGLVSPISTVATESLRGQTVQASIYIRPSATATYRIAVISQTTAADTPTIDVVNTWTSTTYTASNFFIAGSGVGTPTSVNSSSILANTWTRLSTSMVVPDDAVNLVFVVWSESTLPQNTTMDVSGAAVYESASALGWRPVNLSGVKSEALAWTNIEERHSLLHNSSFLLAQRQVPGTLTSCADDTYSLDRWYALTQTAAIQTARGVIDGLADTGSNGNYYAKLTQNQAAAQRMGIAQILESSESTYLRGKQIYLSCRVQCSSSQPIRMALLEWTSTADSVTSDVVNTWTSSTYTAGNFFVASNVTVNTVVAVTPTANTWTDIVIKGVTLGSSCNNIIVMMWTEGTAAQNVNLYFNSVLLCIDNNPHTTKKYLPKSNAEEIRNCQRYYEKSYQPDIAPGTSSATDGRLVHFAHSVASGYWAVQYKAVKRVSGTVTAYNPSTGTSAEARNESAGTNLAITTDSNPGVWGVNYWTTAALVDGQRYSLHFTTDSEL